MNIAFYATMRRPDHSTPSGDRLMADLLIKALQKAGHDVRLVNSVRTFSHVPDEAARRRLKDRAHADAKALSARWSSTTAEWRPACWFTYHPYYKAPDWLGPEICARLAIPYLTAESSYAPKRDSGPWHAWQADVVGAVRQAARNFCFTERDKAGLLRIEGRRGLLVDLPPFIDPGANSAAVGQRTNNNPPRLVTVAMMRADDKLASYRVLANALAGLLDIPWVLTVIGDGPKRAAVRDHFSRIPPGRLEWRGELSPDGVLSQLAACDIYVWPGIGEAYGLAYLEAQAAGLPVIAQSTAGVPAVVKDGITGFLTPFGDVQAFAQAVRRLLVDRERRAQLGNAARHFVLQERTVARAAVIMDAALRSIAAEPIP
jgi:glycosyltransferase involved in cell wall biosynthesis